MNDEIMDMDVTEDDTYQDDMDSLWEWCEESGEDFDHAMGRYLAGLD